MGEYHGFERGVGVVEGPSASPTSCVVCARGVRIWIWGTYSVDGVGKGERVFEDAKMIHTVLGSEHT